LVSASPPGGARRTGPDLDATETWLIRCGTPHFIKDYNAAEDVFTRAIPMITDDTYRHEFFDGVLEELHQTGIAVSCPPARSAAPVDTPIAPGWSTQLAAIRWGACRSRSAA
jgi:hypothetical protein